VVVVTAGRIEESLASGAARAALYVLRDGEFGAAGSAEDGKVVPCGLRPDFDGMARDGDVAILAGVVDAAALHLDGDDVGGAVVVEAAGLRIEVQSADFWSFSGHRGLSHGFGAKIRTENKDQENKGPSRCRRYKIGRQEDRGVIT